MASSYYNNTLHVNFESVFAMDDPVEISEQLFAETFELPVEGLSELSEIPKDLVFDARSIVSLFGEPAGSFNAITMEKFFMLTAIVCGVRINWTSILFNILKKMVTPGSKQAKGYAVQISLLLENVPNLELGESSELPSSKILTDKTIHHYIVLNEKVGAEEVAAAPQVKKAPKKQAASKKIPAAAAVGEPVLKNKRTMKKKSGSSQENLEIVVVAQEAVPIQIIAPIPATPAADETSKNNQLLRLREKTIDEVAKFFYSFSFKRVDRSSPSTANAYIAEIQRVAAKKIFEARKINFAPGDGSSAVDIKIRDRLSDIHSFVLEELKEQAKAHGLTWKKTCCSKFFEGRPHDHGAVIARTNTNTPSKCWIRTMIRVDGVWVVEPCSDHWVKIPKPTVNNYVPRQLSYVDTLPAVSAFFKSVGIRITPPGEAAEEQKKHVPGDDQYDKSNKL
ncbi:protein phosphatase 2C [Dorcoceras hygrometricum]|uniref:Protein phosphatase 2C n=1 Tax=Dorcoceras hygrometricum TaxID=472368 RepID=A0A2Z7BT78_9LAMI|nr:protein phosphatase 2C [Dorcoceras hygrometricum]